MCTAGATVFWKSGSGTLEQTWSGEYGWPLDTAFTLVCTVGPSKCTIDARSGYRAVLWVRHGGSVFSNFINLVLRGANRSGYGDRGGGMMIEAGSKVNVVNCEIASNKAYKGGGIYVDEGSDVNLHATVFLDNSAVAMEGADIYGGSGAGTSVNIYGSTFSPTSEGSANIYTLKTTITFQGSECNAGEEGVNASHVPTIDGDLQYVRGRNARAKRAYHIMCSTCTHLALTLHSLSPCSSPMHPSADLREHTPAARLACSHPFAHTAPLLYSRTCVAHTHARRYYAGTPASYLAGPAGCRDCRSGRYSGAPHAELCSLCQVGTYTDKFKTVGCSGCKMGTYMSSLGAAACTGCEPGK